MSRALTLGLTGSALVTCGTAYYLLSDGGDADVARTRVDQAVDQAIGTVRGGTEAGESGAVSSSNASVSAHTGMRDGVPRRRDGAPVVSGDASSRADADGGYRGCHTCSGPRVWFYADKLGFTRIKRRITPYPDPEP